MRPLSGTVSLLRLPGGVPEGVPAGGWALTKAAVYLRISRKDEEEILRNQRRAALEYVKNHGWELVGEPYEDTASGGVRILRR